jgi:hypothetical protein
MEFVLLSIMQPALFLLLINVFNLVSAIEPVGIVSTEMYQMALHVTMEIYVLLAIVVNLLFALERRLCVINHLTNVTLQLEYVLGVHVSTLHWQMVRVVMMETPALKQILVRLVFVKGLILLFVLSLINAILKELATQQPGIVVIQLRAMELPATTLINVLKHLLV